MHGNAGLVVKARRMWTCRDKFELEAARNQKNFSPPKLNNFTIAPKNELQVQLVVQLAVLPTDGHLNWQSTRNMTPVTGPSYIYPALSLHLTPACSSR